MRKEITEQEAYLQLAALCAQTEHCQEEMRVKMRRWELNETVQNRIVSRLVKERYDRVAALPDFGQHATTLMILRRKAASE